MLQEFFGLLGITWTVFLRSKSVFLSEHSWLKSWLCFIFSLNFFDIFYLGQHICVLWASKDEGFISFFLSPNSCVSRTNSLGMNRSYLACNSYPFLVLSFSHDVMQLFFWMISMCLPQQVCYFLIIIVLFIFLKGKFHLFIKKTLKTYNKTIPNKSTFFFSSFPLLIHHNIWELYCKEYIRWQVLHVSCKYQHLLQFLYWEPLITSRWL